MQKIVKKLLKETQKPHRTSIRVLQNVVMGEEFNDYLKLINDVSGKINTIDLITPEDVHAIRADWIKQMDFHPVFSYNEKKMRQFIADVNDVENFLWPTFNYRDDIRLLLERLAKNRARDIEATAELIESIIRREPNWGNQILFEKYGKVPVNLDIESALRVDELTLEAEKVTNDAQEDKLSNKEQELLYLMHFDAEAIKYWFEWSLDKYGFDIPVIISDEVTDISVTQDAGYGYVVKIPKHRIVNGVKLLELNSHEIECHVRDFMNARALLRPFDAKVGIGRIDSDILSEGHAKLQDAKFYKKYFGEIIEPVPWYVLAISLGLEGNGFLKTANYLYDYLIEMYDKNTSAKEAWKYTYRVFRGSQNTFPCKEGETPFVFTKDKAYLEGYLLARELEENDLGHWLNLGGLKPEELLSIAKVVDFQPEEVPYPLKDTTDAMLKLFLSDATAEI